MSSQTYPWGRVDPKRMNLNSPWYIQLKKIISDCINFCCLIRCGIRLATGQTVSIPRISTLKLIVKVFIQLVFCIIKHRVEILDPWIMLQTVCLSMLRKIVETRRSSSTLISPRGIGIDRPWICSDPDVTTQKHYWERLRNGFRIQCAKCQYHWQPSTHL